MRCFFVFKVFFQIFGIGMCLLFLSGCNHFFGSKSYIRDRIEDYQQETIIKPLKIPKGMHIVPRETRYELPLISKEKMIKVREVRSQKFMVPRVELSLERSSGEFYRISTEENPKRLLVNKKNSVLWPAILDFFQENGIKLTVNNPKNMTLVTEQVLISEYLSEDRKEDAGDKKRARQKEKENVWDIIVSHWLDKSVFSKVRNYTRSEHIQLQLLLRMEEDLQTSAIMMTSVLSPKKSGARPVSKEQQEKNAWYDAQLVTSLLNEIAIFLSQEEGTGIDAFSYDDRFADLKKYAEIDEEGNGEPVLNIRNISFVRGWNAVGRALKDSKIKIVDKDRSAGLYYIVWYGEGTGEGKGKGKKKSTTKNNKNAYRVRIGLASEVIQVTVEEDSSSIAPREISENILKLIQENLR